MKENFNKFLIYFKKDIFSYWQLTNNEKVKGVLKKYPISIKQRILEGHYPSFDEEGIPVIGNLYHYTTICSYALGNWELYLDTDDEKYLSTFFKVADFVFSRVASNGEIIQEAYGSHMRGLSAMIQGEAISVLTRAWEASQDDKYLKKALLCQLPFTKGIDKGGIVGVVSKTNTKWYEEYTDTPLCHVLNGKIYALWGLYDLWLATKEETVKVLFDTGVSSVVKNLPLFDTGYWSYYWIAEEKNQYIASLMYHNLHICQLEHTAKITGSDEIAAEAIKYLNYSKQMTNRLRAGYGLLEAKVKNKIFK